MNNDGGETAVAAAIDMEIEQRERALAEQKAQDKVASVELMEGK
jgi:hypothetical protein